MKRSILQAWLLVGLLYAQITPAYELPAKLEVALNALHVEVLEVTPKGQGGNCMPLSIARSIQNRNSSDMDELLKKYDKKYSGWVCWGRNPWRDQQYLTACATSIRYLLADKLGQILENPAQFEQLQTALTQLASLNLIRMDNSNNLLGQIGLILGLAQSAGDTVSFENAEQIIQLLLKEITGNRQGMTGLEVAVLLAMAHQQPVLTVNAIMPGRVTIVLITPEANRLSLQHIVIEMDNESISATDLMLIQEMFNQAHVHLLLTPGHAQPLLPAMVSEHAYQASINGVLIQTGSRDMPFTRGKPVTRGKLARFKPAPNRKEFDDGWEAYKKKHRRRAAREYKPEPRSYKPLVGGLFVMASIAGTAGYVYSTNPKGWNQYFWKQLCEGQKDSGSCANAWFNWSADQCKAGYDSACQTIRDGYDYLTSQ